MAAHLLQTAQPITVPATPGTAIVGVQFVDLSPVTNGQALLIVDNAGHSGYFSLSAINYGAATATIVLNPSTGTSPGGTVIAALAIGYVTLPYQPGVYTGGQGAGILDFGPVSGYTTTLAVTGQAGIVATSRVSCWFNVVASVDHTAEEHAIETIHARAGNVVVGSGFTIYGSCITGLTFGKWNVGWAWS